MKYLATTLCSFFILIVAWLIGVNAQKGVLTKDNQWIDEAYQLKDKYSESIHKQKVLIVSGSNSLFGFDSPMLESSWSLPVINMGTHAGLGVRYILERSKKNTHARDIVLLPFEFSFYQTDNLPTEVLSDFVIAWDNFYYDQLPFKDQFLLSFSMGYKRFFTGLLSTNIKSITPTKGVYSIENMNKNGDKTNLEVTAYERSKRDSFSAQKLSNSDLSKEFIDIMQRYMSWARDNNICLIGIPPNYMYFKQYKGMVNLDFYSNIKGFYKKNNIPFVGDFYDYMFAREYYFNSLYHLNSRGIAKRTKQLIIDTGGDIRKYCSTQSLVQ